MNNVELSFNMGDIADWYDNSENVTKLFISCQSTNLRSLL